MSLVLNVEILGEFKKLTAATQGAQNSLSGLQKKVGGIARGIGRTVGALGLTLGFGAIVRGFKDAAQAAEEAQVANDRIDAIAKSMNEFGTQTEAITKRIKKYAETNSLSLGVDDEVIKATQAKLLTFRELTKTADKMNGSFDRATKATIDMAAAGFGSAESNAVALGKALNDPIKGVTALTRMGIQLTKEQRNMVKAMVETRDASAAVAVGLFEDEKAYNDYIKASLKAGESAKDTAKFFRSELTPAQYELFNQLRSTSDMLGAQDLILKEIESQVGGTAAATVTATERMNIAFGEISESVGLALLPVLEAFSDWLVEILPSIQTFFTELVDPTTDMGKKWNGMIGVLDNTGEAFDNLIGVFNGSKPSQGSLMDWVTTLSAGLGQIAFYLTRIGELFQATISFQWDKIPGLALGYGADYNEFVRKQNLAYDPQQGIKPGQVSTPKQSVTININKGNVTAKEIANAVNKGAKTSGTPKLNFGTVRAN
jgi:hypothetical protein